MKAFEGGDELAEAESILNLCSTLVKTLGAMAGPEGAAVAGLLGALFSTITNIMGLFEPKKPTLLQQIETLLKQQQANTELLHLQVALGDFDGLEEAWIAGFWRDVNLQNGPEIERVREAALWLQNPENQTEDLRTLWFQVLETQCKVFLETVKAVPLALEALNKQAIPPYQKYNSAGLLTVGLKTTQRKQLEFLKKIVPVLQDRGIFWYLSTDGWFACADYCTDYHEKPNPPFRGLGVGPEDRMSVAIAAADKGKRNPRLHVFALGGGSIKHGRMSWPSGGLEEYRYLPVEDSKDCSDVWATYGASNPEDKERIYFYTANGGKELRGYVLGVKNSKGESQVMWRQPVDKVTSVRVVHFPKAVADDADENPENPRVLDDVSWIVYGACKSSGHIFVWSSDGKKGFVPIQDASSFGSDTYEVMAVDQRYVWISAAVGHGAVAATHTSVLACLRNPAQFPRPAWFPATESTDLSPCDDRTLFRVARTAITYKPYTITKNDFSILPRDGGRIVTLRDNWTDLLAYQAKQVQKLPHYDWPLVGGLIASLEKGTA